MVNRSPSSNFAFRYIRNMAPQPTGSGKKGKGLRNKVTSKFPPGSAPPVTKQKRKVSCTKCKESHFPPTGRACQKVLSAPNPDLSSTLAHTEEQAPFNSPTLSPVRRDLETQAALDMLQQQARLIAQASPTLSPARPLSPVTPERAALDSLAAQAQFLAQAQAQVLAQALPTATPLVQASHNPTSVPGPSSQSAPRQSPFPTTFGFQLYRRYP